MIDDDDLPDWEELSIGEPQNDTHGAVCAMLTEHMIDADRLNRWLLGLMIVSMHECGLSRAPLHDALEMITVMSESDMAIAGFNIMNDLVGGYKQKGTRKRARRTEG